MEQERYEMAITDGAVWIVDTLAADGGGMILAGFKGPDRLMRATEELARIARPNPWPLDRRRADLVSMLNQANRIEGKLIAMIAEDGERLKRATALRRKLEASLAALSATETAQDDVLVGVYTYGMSRSVSEAHEVRPGCTIHASCALTS